ncbi:uncharacterized protein LY79DRAFT_167209 [Colletotrichum navitas]|uniref:Uncharacterized protein n=1 Tax=Colletotrichum navitas TaxID=681940 RepID=A0AAD8Q192_9PEZI|nr:uncharacterized protein LY79DRAFT_167209 [Colletotrichum navitas]KAK1594022.1 hypothetical protein LY79DRAFT_167209 [Colletotrichum navitas]
MNVCLCRTPPRQRARRAQRIEMRETRAEMDRSWYPTSLAETTNNKHDTTPYCTIPHPSPSLPLWLAKGSWARKQSLGWGCFVALVPGGCPKAKPRPSQARLDHFGAYLALIEVSMDEQRGAKWRVGGGGGGGECLTGSKGTKGRGYLSNT